MTISETLALAPGCHPGSMFLESKEAAQLCALLRSSFSGVPGDYAAYWTYVVLFNHVFHSRPPFCRCFVAAIIYFLLNSIPVAAVVALAESTSIIANGTPATPGLFLITSSRRIAGLIQFVNRLAGWEMLSSSCLPFT